MKINAYQLDETRLNEMVREANDVKIEIENCNGQRYIAAGAENKEIDLYGVPGNALAAYLNGGIVRVFGNAQEAIGDTMNSGEIFVYGRVGDGTGYAMRGGTIYVREDVGYRAGIHMKAYGKHVPTLVIGGKSGNFLGEYQAGGNMIVLNLNDQKNPLGKYCAVGMHGGKIYLRNPDKIKAPLGVEVHPVTDLSEIETYLKRFAKAFDIDEALLMDAPYCVLTPTSKNPYRRLYVNN